MEHLEGPSHSYSRPRQGDCRDRLGEQVRERETVYSPPQHGYLLLLPAEAVSQIAEGSYEVDESVWCACSDTVVQNTVLDTRPAVENCVT